MTLDASGCRAQALGSQMPSRTPAPSGRPVEGAFFRVLVTETRHFRRFPSVCYVHCFKNDSVVSFVP